MTFTYSGDPADSDLDAVRFLSLQNSSGDDVLIEDEEIEYLLGQGSGVYRTAAEVCNRLALKYGSRASIVTIGKLSVEYAGRAAEYSSRCGILRREAAVRGSVPFAGGVDQADLDATAADTSLVPPKFTIGQDDSPHVAWGLTTTT
jgi:hypothetical protein